MKVVLASSSPYRRALLERLALDFTVEAPEVDETRRAGESADTLVRRLAHAKAAAVAESQPGALVIGSDQVAVLGQDVLGKPGDFARNVAQLRRLSGCEVRFLIGLCLLNSDSGAFQLDVVPFEVRFRALSEEQITAYVKRERAFDCAGGFRSEGLGIALFESLSGDPTALVGLPLIRLVEMLKTEGLDVLTS